MYVDAQGNDLLYTWNFTLSQILQFDNGIILLCTVYLIDSVGLSEGRQMCSHSLHTHKAILIMHVVGGRKMCRHNP